jgi:hypothetical protein
VERLNGRQNIYREKASLSLSLALAARNSYRSNAFGIVLAANSEMRCGLLNVDKDINENKLVAFCKKARNEVLTRCIGLLDFNTLPLRRHTAYRTEIARSQDQFVEFSHRTSLEFIISSEQGREIVKPLESERPGIAMQLDQADVMDNSIGESSFLCYSSSLQ